MGISKINLDGTTYEITPEPHGHQWIEVKPTNGTVTTVTNSYCAYSTELGLGVIRMTVKVTPTSEITNGTSIVAATISGDIVPDFVCPLATSTGSTNSRRWNAWINSSGQICIRPNASLPTGADYNVYICGTYPMDV